LFGAHVINRKLPKCVGDENSRQHREEFHCVLCGISSLFLRFVPPQECFFLISISTRKTPGFSTHHSQEVALVLSLSQMEDARRRDYGDNIQLVTRGTVDEFLELFKTEVSNRT
jgi:hypothetical protein